MTAPASLRIDPVTEKDVPVLLGLIKALADYERLSHIVTATESDLRDVLFGERRSVEAVIASVDGQPAGYALWFHTYSTFLGKRGLYLEDIFVRPEFRGRGIGRALLTHLARIAVERGYGRVDWCVLDWNEPAIGFYRQMGAELLPDWKICRLTGASLQELGGSGSRT